jgi:arylsulfatase A-like enzyme
VDILPTLIDAAGGKITDPIDGRSLLPVLTQQSTEPVHECLYWAGLHSRYFGFLLNKTFKNDPGIAPYAWAIVKDNYLLRFVGTMAPNVYTDFPDGRPPVYELYNIKNDPTEKYNIIENMPDKIQELKLLYYNKASTFPPPPSVQDIDRWEEILPQKNISSLPIN